MIGDDFASVVDGCGSGTLRLKKSNLQHKTPRSAHWIDLQGFCSGSGQQASRMFFGGGRRGERGLVRRPGDIALLDSLSVWLVEDSDDKFLGLSPLEPRIKA
jgi:hypothetical protein